MRVLIVDDSAVMRRIVERALRHSAPDLAEVLEAANGLEALAVLEQTSEQPLDLILCDVHMPVMDGLGFLIEKPRRDLAPGVPVVMITADATDPHLLRAIAAGAQGYISKPFTLEQMHASVISLTHAYPRAAPALRSTGSVDKRIGNAQ
ncbi:MAG: response regulator [Acidobacteriota bacterium]|nr:response regulator [Acidobacteriota bacterium]